jgi:hypothetical protein
MDNIVRFRQKPTELIRGENPHMPSANVIAKFRLPRKLKIQQLASVAETIDLAELGIHIPRCRYPERYEAGVRYGLAHNLRTDVKTQFRPLFSSGFCLAKIFYRTLEPNHPLAASGSYKMKVDRHWQIMTLGEV